MKPRNWRDLVLAIYDPAEVEALVRARGVRDLLKMASQPGMPSEPFHTLANEIASDTNRSDKERLAARQALRIHAAQDEQERAAIERARIKAEFDALPVAPSSDSPEDFDNPFLAADDSG